MHICFCVVRPFVCVYILFTCALKVAYLGSMMLAVYYVTRELRREIYAPAETTKERLQDTTEAGLVAWCTGMLGTLKNGKKARY